MDAWLLARRSDRACAELITFLAELGFTPYNPILGPKPSRARAGARRPPALVVVVADPGEPVPGRLYEALAADPELDDTGLMLAVEPEHVEEATALGAVELIVWPFAPEELEFRVARALARVSGSRDGDVVRSGAIELHLRTHRAFVDGEPLSLTNIEYRLLLYLATHPDRVLAREQLLVRVWGEPADASARTVDVHVSRLRGKLGREQGARIATVRGAGYVLGERGAPRPAAEWFAPRRPRERAPRSQDEQSWRDLLGAPGAAARPCAGSRRAHGRARVRIGFLPLTDAAPVIMAHENRFFEQRGVEAQLIKLGSWPETRDALVGGGVDAAHALFSLPFSAATGIGGTPSQARRLRIAMVLDQNGQAISLRGDWAAAGYGDPGGAQAVLGGAGRTYAMTFPGGTHDTWLRYWLKAAGIDPTVPRILPVPPARMVDGLEAGVVDGCCVGEPWNALAAARGVGFTTLATQDLWEFHPEKALVVNAGFADGRTTDLMRVMGGILAAASWLDRPENAAATAAVLARPEYLGTSEEVIQGRLNGVYELGEGLGTRVFGADRMRFSRGGRVNFPGFGHAIWFMAQYVRLGYLAAEPSYGAIARELILQDLYKRVADREGVAVPDDDMAPFSIKLDGAEFDPRRPRLEAARR